MMFFGLIAIVAVIYFIWRNNGGKTEVFMPHKRLEQMTDEELEAELAKRRQVPNLEAEVADLKKQLNELKQQDPQQDSIVEK